MTGKLLYLALIALLLTLTACGQKKNQTNTTKVETKTTVKPTAEMRNTDSKLFGANLLKNGGAEAGKSAPWISGDELKTFDYNGGWGDAWQVTPPNKGEKFFYAGVSWEKTTVAFSQEFDVSEIAKEIDAARVGYNSGAWFGVRGAAAGRLKVEFYDANKALISRPKDDTDATEKITSANKPDDVTMVERTRGGDVPAGTRKIKVTLEFSLFEDAGKENNGESPLADNLSLVLTNKQ
jgi:hypothetical protein